MEAFAAHCAIFCFKSHDDMLLIPQAFFAVSRFRARAGLGPLGNRVLNRVS
jgi:hypothetical protein